MNVACTIDKISITGNWKLRREYMLDIFKEVVREKNGEFGICKYPYRYSMKLESVYMQISERDAKNIKEGRVEFNPNKCDLEFVTDFIREYMKDKEITRLDIAIDYEGVDISNYLIWTERRVSSSWNYGKKLESVYIGSRSSERFYRIYDKRLEVLEEEGRDIGIDIMRCEGVVRRIEQKLDDLFRGIKLYRVNDIEDKGLLLLALYYPGELNMLSRYKRNKLEQMLSEGLEPYKDYLANKEKIAREIELLVNWTCIIDPFTGNIAELVKQENNFFL
ncbi:MAG: hypothetical protein ACPL5F_01005 [Moorellaceae bacterium]